MSNWPYVLYALVLGIISVVTGEIVTFVMLGLILISLQNIHRVLKELVKINQTDTK